MPFVVRKMSEEMSRLKSLISSVLSLCILCVLCGCSSVINTINQDDTPYDFHETKWGYTQAQVMLSEIDQKSIIALRTPETLIYKCKLGDVNALRIYTFKNNRLRCAGYVTKHPVKGKINNRFHEMSIEKHGEPNLINFNGGDMWVDGNTIIYAKSYTSYQKVFVPLTINKSQYSMDTASNTGCGLFPILDSGTPLKRSTHLGIINRWSSVWSYTDRNFYSQSKEFKFPLMELSIAEQVLFGIIEKRFILELVPVF